MATRSAIIRKTEEGTFEGIYCHFDGYPDHHAPILLNHYTDPEKVKALIALGQISELGERVDPVGPHSYEEPEDGTTVAYHRDRGEKLRPARTGDTVEEVEEQIGHDGAVYVFADGEWTYNGRPLAEVMREIEPEE